MGRNTSTVPTSVRPLVEVPSTLKAGTIAHDVIHTVDGLPIAVQKVVATLITVSLKFDEGL
jgi:hypothetical protein